MSTTETATPPVAPKTEPKAKQPSNNDITKALATLEAAGIMDSEEQQEAIVALKVGQTFAKLLPMLAVLTNEDTGKPEAPTEGGGIAIFADGVFFFLDDEDDEKAVKKAAKKAAKKEAAKDGEGDWKADAKIIQTALIKYAAEKDKKAADIIKTLSKGRNAQPPSVTTVYNWLKASSLPRQKYHRKLRSLLGDYVG